MFIHVEMPCISGLQTDYRSVFAIIGAVGADNADIQMPVVFRVLSELLADLFAAALFALFPGADVDQFGRRMFVFAHRFLVAASDRLSR